MKFLLATSIKYPSPLANRAQVERMANAFFDALGGEFLFGGRNLPTEAAEGMELLRIAGKKVSYLFAFKYIREIRKRNISHVYCREEKMLFFMLLFDIAYRTGATFIYESHFLPERLGLWWRFVLRRVDYVVVTSSAIRDGFEQYIAPEKIIVAVHGVDINQFAIETSKEAARTQVRLPNEGFVVGYTGTARTMGGVTKGVEELLGAIAKNPDTTAVLVGIDERDEAELQRLVKKLDIEGRVMFARRVARDELALYQRACDVLVLPMRLNQYASMLPLKVFEYMASGRPIIASSLPSVADVLNSKNAYLVTPGDVNELAEAIANIKKSPSSYEHRAALARADVAQYSWSNRAQKILKVIAQ